MTESEINYDIDDSEEQQFKLPPKPVPLFPAREGEMIRYEGDHKDMKLRIRYKLYNLWLLWIKLRVNKELEELLKRETEDKQSDEFTAKATIISVMDLLAKCLSDTDLLQEWVWLIPEKTN